MHLHPISETHQFRPTLTYLDVLSRQSKRSRARGSDSDSDDGPPPDPDEPAPVPVQKKERKPTDEAREVQVSARKSEDKGGLQPLTGGLSTVRREMLAAIRAEDDEAWKDIQFFDGEVREWLLLAHPLCSPGLSRHRNPAMRSRLSFHKAAKKSSAQLKSPHSSKTFLGFLNVSHR